MSDRYRDRSRSRSRDRDRDRDRDRGRDRALPRRDDDGGRDRRDRDGDRRRDGNDRYRDRGRDGDRSDRDRDRDRGRDHLRPTRSRSRSPGRGGSGSSRRSPDRRHSEIQQQREQKILSGISGKNPASATESRLAMVKALTGAEDDEKASSSIGPDGEDDVPGGTSEEDVMAMMGFAGFGSTKGKPVESNQHSSAVGTVAKHKKRVYRQYMNRRGGFNRPLQKMN